MKKFNLSLGTINEIIKNGEEILKEEVGTKFNKRKANFSTKIFDEELFEWFIFKRRRFSTIQDSNLQEMALKLACLYKLDNFKASNGWLKKFKIRHNIKCRSIQGESGFVDNNIIEEFSSQYSKKLSSYSKADVFNCDEAGMFFKCTPTRTLCHSTENQISESFQKIE
ncbi:Tigger transposable element-derived protein 6 [Dictyocoela muelleri]|nr:Tigger transposable element-derived protein 6 [Dictyocoela muelleri]